jgi:hypothetical protein
METAPLEPLVPVTHFSGHEHPVMLYRKSRGSGGIELDCAPLQTRAYPCPIMAIAALLTMDFEQTLCGRTEKGTEYD